MISSAGQAIISWMLIAASVVLAAGITYVYTNRNQKLTFISVIASILLIALIKLVDIVHDNLSQQFLGKFDASNLPYIVGRPGWNLLLSAWHIWILPALTAAGASICLVLGILHDKKTDAPKARIFTPLPVHTPHIPTGAEKLSAFMLIDTAKKQTRRINEKLTQALLENASYKIQNSEMKFRIENLDQALAALKKQCHTEIETLKLELSAKNKENDYLSRQLLEHIRRLTNKPLQ